MLAAAAIRPATARGQAAATGQTIATTGWDYPAQAHAIIRALYPELLYSGRTFTVSSALPYALDSPPHPLSTLSIRILEPPRAADQRIDSLFVVFVDFSEDGALWGLTTGESQFLSTARVNELEKAMRGRDRSETACRHAFELAGARLTNEADVKAALRPRLADVGVMLGGRIRLLRVECAASAHWRAELVVDRPSQSAVFYRAGIEPFNGRIIAIDRYDP